MEHADANREPSTVYVADILERCEDIDDLRNTVLPLLKTQKERWGARINEILARTGCTKMKFAELCGVSRVSLDKWCKGAIPKNRESFLRIGMAADYGTEQINELLQKYGGYQGLYPKTLEDCVCIFVTQHFSEAERIEKYDYILDRIRRSIIGSDENDAEDMSTEMLGARLRDVHDESQLEGFIRSNINVFATAYNRLYAYIKTYIEANGLGYASSVNELADAQQWSSSLRQCVSAIRQKKWYPTRNKIISLGLHLNFDHEQIDEMLEYAHMQPLYAKNVFESVIIFILEDAQLNDMLNEDSDDYDPDALCAYAREILKEFDLPEAADFISELPDEED